MLSFILLERKPLISRTQLIAMGKKWKFLILGLYRRMGERLPVGPAEFLYLVHHAELILTDSFHASVFSILFHKRFITFKRPGIDMSSRIVSLANTIGAVGKLDEKNNLDCSDRIRLCNS